MANSLRNPEYREIIYRLKAAREAAGITQQQLADQLGKTQSFIAKIEGYERRLDVLEFKRILSVLNLDSKVALGN